MRAGSQPSLAEFVSQGMEAVAHHYSSVNKKLPSVIMVTTPIYEKLLVKAFKGLELYTGKITGENRPIRYDSQTKLFSSAEDGQLLIPIKLVETKLQAVEGGPMSTLGAELVRRAKAGTAEESLLKYDEAGNYLGVVINGKLTRPGEIRKIYPSKVCEVCAGPSNSKCSVCRSVSYCSAACQRTDWPTHKTRCDLLRQATVILK